MQGDTETMMAIVRARQAALAAEAATERLLRSVERARASRAGAEGGGAGRHLPGVTLADQAARCECEPPQLRHVA